MTSQHGADRDRPDDGELDGPHQLRMGPGAAGPDHAAGTGADEYDGDGQGAPPPEPAGRRSRRRLAQQRGERQPAEGPGHEVHQRRQDADVHADAGEQPADAERRFPRRVPEVVVVVAEELGLGLTRPVRRGGRQAPRPEVVLEDLAGAPDVAAARHRGEVVGPRHHAALLRIAGVDGDVEDLQAAGAERGGAHAAAGQRDADTARVDGDGEPIAQGVGVGRLGLGHVDQRRRRRCRGVGRDEARRLTEGRLRRRTPEMHGQAGQAGDQRADGVDGGQNDQRPLRNRRHGGPHGGARVAVEHVVQGRVLDEEIEQPGQHHGAERRPADPTARPSPQVPGAVPAPEAEVGDVGGDQPGVGVDAVGERVALGRGPALQHGIGPARRPGELERHDGGRAPVPRVARGGTRSEVAAVLHVAERHDQEYTQHQRSEDEQDALRGLIPS